MSIKGLTPYFFFNGTAEKAIRFYERVLDAKVEGLQQYKDMPSSSKSCAPADTERVMHACLRIGQANVMVSDTPVDMPGPTDGNVHVNLDFDDVEDMARKFDALAASGKVDMNLHDTFWGARFGMLTDEFGIHWMFTCMLKAG